MAGDESPSETSPLIPKPRSNLPQSPAPNGAVPNGVNSNGQAHEHNKSVDEEETRSDEEGRERQYEGMPEVRKQLKYIVPAIAIGVWLGCQGKRRCDAEDSRSSCLLATRQSSSVAMAPSAVT